MESRMGSGTSRVLRRLVIAALMLGVSSAAWLHGAEAPDKMAVRSQAEQTQKYRVSERDARKLPYVDGPIDQLSDWSAGQTTDRSIILDDFTATAGLNSVTAAPGLKLASSTWDAQHNDAAPHQCAMIPSPLVGDTSHLTHFVWTHWDVLPESLNRVDRFVNFHSYNPVTGLFFHGASGETISGAGGDPLLARAGFVTIDVNDQDRAMISAQQRDAPQQPSGDYCSYWWEQSASSFAVFNEGFLNGSKGTLGNPADDILYPHITVDRQAGADWHYVISHTESANDHMVLWRYNGSIWQGPYVIDSTPFLSYNIAADPTSDKIALISNGPPISADPSALSQVMYRFSLSRGDDWGPVNTSGLGDGNRVYITNYTDPSGPSAWAEVVGDYDNSGDLHIVWVEQRHTNVGDQAALKHWDANSNTIATIHQAYWDNTGQNSKRKLNAGFPTMGFGDGSTTCGGGNNLDYVYVTFVQFGGLSTAEQADQSRHGYMNGEIYLSASNDGGLHWSPAKNLTNSHGPGCDPALADSCPSENWPSLARTVNDTMHLMYINDRDAGDAPFGQGAWTFNSVMYYRIPGGTNVQPVCPQIAPNASITLTDANGPECEYNTPPNTQLHETLVLANLGNATMAGIVSKTYLNPPSGTWLSVTTGPYSIPVGGAALNFPVTMNAIVGAEGLYTAQISITHNDPTKPSPIAIPVDFFVFNSFACPQYVVLHTRWLELEVSNIERVAVGPDRPHIRGLYRAPRFGESDSGNNSIYDASLIIARPPSPDTIVYRSLFGIGNYAKGFRALSNLTVDTSRYGTNAGAAYARAKQTTVDSILGVDAEYEFPQNPDSSNFVLINYRISNRTGSAISGLIVGEATDFDIMPPHPSMIWTPSDVAGVEPGWNLVYQQGADTGGAFAPRNYLAGMTAIQCSAAPRAWSAANGDMLFPTPGGGFSEGYLYRELAKSGFEVIPPGSPGANGGADMHSVLAFENNVSLGPLSDKHYTLGFVTSTAGPTDADLLATTKKAWRYAFGWKSIVKFDTLFPDTPKSYRYAALGSHENGPASGCCGCVVSKISDPSNKYTLVPDSGGCTGTITFSGAAIYGEFAATFRVSSPPCNGLVYTDDWVVAIVIGSHDSCPFQGDINGDGVIDVFDVIGVIGIAFNGEPDPQDPTCPITRGDANNNLVTDVFDVVYLIEYAFNGGPPPIDPFLLTSSQPSPDHPVPAR
ncbi:MAG: hypothetical protein HZB43_12815 [candidate division Zixibacteria bacterium]|nr:hypothetical protein [candidate division Zixibacteria bacterium]